jgi:hypothetical protein
MPERQISASKVRRIQIFTGPFFPPFTSNVGQEMVPASHHVELNKEPKCEEFFFFLACHTPSLARSLAVACAFWRWYNL